MSTTSEQIVPKRQGKSVTFSEECNDNEKSYHQRYVDAGIVFPKTRVPENVVDVVFRKNWTPVRFPQAEEIIDLPISEGEEIIPSENCKPSSSRHLLSNGHLFEDSDVVKFRKSRRLMSRSTKTSQMNEIYKKLKRINQLKQMDDLTALCKEKMSITTKETEKMDEDSID